MRSPVCALLALGLGMSLASCSPSEAVEVLDNQPPPPPPAPNAANTIIWSSVRDGNYEIYKMDADGTDVVNLTRNPAMDYTPAVDRSGALIAFSSDRGGHPTIYTMEADGSHLTRLTSNSASEYSPAFSTISANKIAFVREVTPGHAQIFVMDESGLNQVNISNTTHNDTQPSWSPDGTKIVFASDRDAKFGVNTYLEIYTMNADGSGVTRLTFNDDGIDYYPKWSPDGTKIMFTTDRATNTHCYAFALDVWTMNANGTGQTNLTNDCHGDANAAFDFRGDNIVFISDRATGSAQYAWDLYRMPVGGGTPIRLTTTKADLGPVWP